LIIRTTMGMGRRRRHDSERGAAAVEMALVLPILVVLVFGIIEFGFLFNAQIALTQAAREGVRVESIGNGNGKTTAEAAFVASVPLGVGSATASVTKPCGTDKAEVRISAPYTWFFFPFTDRSLVGQAVMRCGG
jgi:Flp pilus assembly protein TadG